MIPSPKLVRPRITTAKEILLTKELNPTLGSNLTTDRLSLNRVKQSQWRVNSSLRSQVHVKLSYFITFGDTLYLRGENPDKAIQFV